MKTGRLKQLVQLAKATWDGDLISKTDRDELVKCGMAYRCEGWNVITADGIRCLVNLGILTA